MVKCAHWVLEPIMKLDVFAPEEKVGDVIGDLNRRRGVIQGREGTPGGIHVKAEAPLSVIRLHRRPPHLDPDSPLPPRAAASSHSFVGKGSARH